MFSLKPYVFSFQWADQLKRFDIYFFFFDLHGVFGLAYAHHDYSPRPAGHLVSPGTGKAPRDIFIKKEGILIDYCEGAGNLACM
jgi:hypothetical protein